MDVPTLRRFRESWERLDPTTAPPFPAECRDTHGREDGMAKKWKDLSNNTPISKWGAGLVVEGTLLGLRPGKFNDRLMDVRTADGDVCYPTKAVLERCLGNAAPGTEI